MATSPPPTPPEHQPAIDYPCLWTYKVIGTNPGLLEELIITACAPLAVTISHSQSSSKGRYHSLNARVQVPSEEVRLQIYQLLSLHPEVKIVL